MDLETIRSQLDIYRDAGLKALVTSSFQTHSIPMLHLLQQCWPGLSIYFLDTGYHFPETLTFRDEVVELLDLNLRIVKGLEDKTRSPLYVVSESSCCAINKVDPLTPHLVDHDVWISGVRADQTSTRQTFDTTTGGPHNTQRYHPMLRWTQDDIDAYRGQYNLPEHPLDALGYRSIGCVPCTAVPVETDSYGRTGRWPSSEKTECGLHLAR